MPPKQAIYSSFAPNTWKIRPEGHLYLEVGICAGDVVLLIDGLQLSAGNFYAYVRYFVCSIALCLFWVFQTFLCLFCLSNTCMFYCSLFDWLDLSFGFFFLLLFLILLLTFFRRSQFQHRWFVLFSCWWHLSEHHGNCYTKALTEIEIKSISALKKIKKNKIGLWILK